MPGRLTEIFRWIFGPEGGDGPGHLWPRWLWLRALGLIFCSAFYSLLFQIRGLIGPQGILPAHEYLKAAAQQLGGKAYWVVPTLYWFGSSDRALVVVCWAGLMASLLLVLNVWPRGMIAICLITFLSFVAAAQDFSWYQSDGMLLGAGFISLFVAPAGWRPGLGADRAPSRASLWLLRWEWFRIYFESGFVKLASHDPEWRSLTALDHYYENGPLPDWVGWYAQQLPHRFQAALALSTLVIELGLVWMLFLPRRFRLACVFIVTPFQIGIILTANLGFLNYLVLVLGFLLLDDVFLDGGLSRLKNYLAHFAHLLSQGAPSSVATGGTAPPSRWSLVRRYSSLTVSAFFLTWVFYNTTALLLMMMFSSLPLPALPIGLLEPFRISNQYGLFAVMTTARYEIEFQGSRDDQTWVVYPFRYKPQDPRRPPKLFAPYQPRFDWNLWFASLGNWRSYPFVVRTEVRLLENSPDVLALFAGDPFDGQPPREVRAVLWQYWFTNLQTKRATGLWWQRAPRGLYAPTLERLPDGRIAVIEMPGTTMPSQ
jgi:hypothetical protein